MNPTKFVILPFSLCILNTTSLYGRSLNCEATGFVNDSIVNDSSKINPIKEAVVTANRGWMEDGKAIFLPTKKEKRLSNSPSSLLKSMHLPVVTEVNGSVIGVSGNEVTYFINGVKADKMDISAFYPKDVRRVEYIENPSDPTFEGCRTVVNFVMEEYEVGGVTKADLFQRLPNYGNFTATSKLVHKNVSFGAMLMGHYTRDHGIVSQQQDVYRDIYIDGTKHDELTRDFEERSIERDNYMDFSLNAKYVSTKFRATHTFSFAWNQNPGSSSSSVDQWSENIFNSQGSSSHSEGKTHTPQISGNYYAQLSKKWFLSGAWLYSFGRSENHSWNQIQQSSIIGNDTEEDVHSFKMTLQPTFMLSPKWYFLLKMKAGLDWFKSKYSGTANTTQNLARQDLISSLCVYWQPTDAFSISVEPGVQSTLSKVGDVKQNTTRPTIDISLNATPCKKLSVGASARFYITSNDANRYNSVMMQESELQWVTGNPQIKNMSTWDTYVYTTYMAANWLRLSWGVGHIKMNNDFINTYRPASADMGGILRRSENADPQNLLRSNLTISGSFFDDNLSVQITPKWYYTKTTGAYAGTFNFFTANGSMDYTLKDCRFGIEYEGPYKGFNLAGMEKSWSHDKWNASFTYGNDNIYLEARVENIFNKKHSEWTRLSSPNFSSYAFKQSVGRCFVINFTYTFGYGKKVSQDIDISSAEDVKTSILRSK